MIFITYMDSIALLSRNLLAPTLLSLLAAGCSQESSTQNSNTTQTSASQQQSDEPAPHPCDAGQAGKAHFEAMNQAHKWQEVFFDSGVGDAKTGRWQDGLWQQKWFLDGEIANVDNEKQGIHLHAGPRWKSQDHHMVLWTKQEFTGDLKIEYEFTRTDMEDIGSVILIYIQATGEGNEGFDEDITKWNDFRKVPYMKSYFQNMNLYHISYSTGSPFIAGNGADYVRARRYMPETNTLRGTELPQEYADTGLWLPGVTYQMTILKNDFEIAMKVAGPDKTSYFYFKNDQFPAVTHGRIGLRHMYTRSARYKNFRVSEVAGK